MTTRREFLSDISHRIRFVYLPKHSSWLNQIEIFFGIAQRKCLRGGNFTSVADLESQLRQFITYYNTTMAHPFNWTYTGKPTKRAAAPISSRPIGVLSCKAHTNHQASPSDETLFPNCGTRWPLTILGPKRAPCFGVSDRSSLSQMKCASMRPF
jgi:hypothetical protein